MSETEQKAREAKPLVPGRFAIWTIVGLSFCLGAISLVGAWLFWRSPGLLAGYSGFNYYYYTFRPVLLAVGFLGLSWRCFRYVDAVTHNAFDSDVVRQAHGAAWNWMAVMLASFFMFGTWIST